MKIIFSAKTDTGRVRKENQDSYGIFGQKNIFFVCDGMGGGAAGDFASRCAVDVIMKSLETLKNSDVAKIITNNPGNLSNEILTVAASIRLANRALSNLSRKYPRLAGMGTTVTVVYFDQQRNILHVFHVGDSRVYRLRANLLELITKDHSKVNELLEQGKMTEEEVKTAEIQSMITRALGTAQKVRIDYHPEYTKDGDYYILCTDGLNGEIEDETIKNVWISNAANIDNVPSALIESANTAAGRDNTTVLALKIYDDKTSKLPPYDSRPPKVITFEEETNEETKAEDKILKKVMADAKIAVPKSASDRSLIGNPIIAGIVLALIVASFGVILSKFSGHVASSDKQIMDLTKMVSGIRVNIREPIKEQLDNYSKTDDNIQKLEIIQDWYRESAKLTLPLKDVEISVSDSSKEKFKGVSGETPLEVRVERGLYSLKVNKLNYVLVREKNETPNEVSISVEPSAAMPSMLLIMIPANSQQ